MQSKSNILWAWIRNRSKDPWNLLSAKVTNPIMVAAPFPSVIEQTDLPLVRAYAATGHALFCMAIMVTATPHACHGNTRWQPDWLRSCCGHRSQRL